MAGMRKGCEKRTLNSLAQRCNEISAYTIVNAAGTESNEGAQSCGLTRRDFEDSDAEKMRNARSKIGDAFRLQVKQD